MAKRGSVQTVIKKAQPGYDYGIVVKLLDSNLSKQPFILVEADWDCVFFRRMLKGKHVNLAKAEEKEKSGYHYVEFIVKKVHETKPKANVIGIRDRDYTRYEHYERPANIYLTDEHSLETMLLHSENVKDALSGIWPDFAANYSKVVQDARYIAKYYIYSILEGLNVDFNDRKMRLNDFADSTNGSMMSNWKEVLRDKFFAQEPCHGRNEADLHKRVVGVNFDNAGDYEVCRGHDLFDTCYNIIHHGSLTPDYIMKTMVESYSYDDFTKTTLCNELTTWAHSVGVVLR